MYCFVTRIEVLAEEEYLKTLFEKQVKGVIISSISSNKELIDDLAKKGLHIVALDQTIDGLNASQIHFDYVKGGYMATEHLLKLGHRKIAFISAPLSRPSRKSVYQGYKNALEKYDVNPDESFIQISTKEEETTEKSYEFTNGIALTRNLLKNQNLPTGIFACNDMTAFGVMNELTSQGLKSRRIYP